MFLLPTRFHSQYSLCYSVDSHVRQLLEHSMTSSLSGSFPSFFHVQMRGNGKVRTEYCMFISCHCEIAAPSDNGFIRQAASHQRTGSLPRDGPQAPHAIMTLYRSLSTPNTISPRQNLPFPSVIHYVTFLLLRRPTCDSLIPRLCISPPQEGYYWFPRPSAHWAASKDSSWRWKAGPRNNLQQDIERPQIPEASAARLILEQLPVLPPAKVC